MCLSDAPHGYLFSFVKCTLCRSLWRLSYDTVVPYQRIATQRMQGVQACDSAMRVLPICQAAAPCQEPQVQSRLPSMLLTRLCRKAWG